MHSSIISEDLIPVDVAVDGSMIRVKFSGGTELSTPVSRFPRLANATAAQRNHWRLIGRGDGIHWPDVDEDISVRTLLRMPKKTPASRVEEIPALIGELLRATQRLNMLFAGRPFTPDGHLVGSIGEVVAEYIYDLDLQRAGTPQIDAHTKDGRTVQIKLTGARGTSYGMRWYKGMEARPADLLVGLQLTDAGFIETYNGPYPVELLRDRPDSRNGQVSISLNKLRRLNPKTLAHVHSFESINRWFAPVISDVA
jgi:hypothetical protein